MTSVRIDIDVLRTAKELGLNVSKTAENALKEAIKRLQTPVQQTETNGGYVDARSASLPPQWWAGPDLNRRSSPREGDVIVMLVLTTLDYRPAKVKR